VVEAADGLERSPAYFGVLFDAVAALTPDDRRLLGMDR
jgi:hypothetical protein